MILYLHGFTSGPASHKAQALQERMAQRGLADRFVCPQLPHAPREAIALCESLLEKVGAGGSATSRDAATMGTATSRDAATIGSATSRDAATMDTPVARGAICANTPTLVGSSLGGYYATWLAEQHDLKAVLVNPAVVAHLALEQFIGPQRNLYTGERFDFTREHVAQLRALEVPRLARPGNFWLLAEAGDEVLDHRLAVEKYAGCRQTVLPGGDHSFTRWDDYLDQIIAFAGLS